MATKPVPYTHDDEAKIREMRERGVVLKVIAIKFGRTENAIRHKVRRMGLVQRKPRVGHRKLTYMKFRATPSDRAAVGRCATKEGMFSAHWILWVVRRAIDEQR